MAEIIDGKELAKKVRKDLKEEVEILKKKGINPKLAVIMVGNDPGSTVYVRNKSKACEKVGIEFEEFLFEESISEEKLLETIEMLNRDDKVHGILLQCPVPKHINVNKAFRAISPNKDVDGFNPINVGNLTIGEDAFISCTPFGVVKMLEEYNIETEGKNAVILGRSNIVGKPMIQCMLNKNSTVTVCHSRTRDIDEVIKRADIVIAAIGKPKFVKSDMIKEGAVVIDVGINRLEDGTICGDVDYEAVLDKAKYITPVPGGVGPMTIAMLLNNVVKAAKLKLN
ncbi:MAG: bifunctional methylenetetrahydrofolate dehydrogenase/methenyltetrahydrofolate cyclohydrolase FolD [Clostridia bacterium]|nr:bifunctional methylenetetrahydrofolate dehydrogenase/methenyltetrahydrofolate cyclohydrolase FolD [Clostridia bacterium]